MTPLAQGPNSFSPTCLREVGAPPPVSQAALKLIAGKEADAGHHPQPQCLPQPSSQRAGASNYPENAGKTPTEPQGLLLLLLFF